MRAIKLSMESFLIKWAEMCIDWFMNFFADPEYYWVEENYPSKPKPTTNLQIESEVETTQKVTSKKHRLTGLFVVDKLLVKSLKRSVKLIQSTHNMLVDIIYQIDWPKIRLPHKQMLQLIKME
ncbi:hypothetical protein [Plebeiibacterium sediminum]|uniref:Uncharacterized protein n=1 Tax=Plebeiibacterium sediminum TaxID=2992112 RepID=A0AAE3M790_9BACT|nr:hypothetical protein [Plebeiobacterium sediminum]MCW3787855.1 hypothetical protein [Plebeiobacterium sediminum]